ncbi:hypothetical protein TNCV_1685801 [Trichonephila clavipes]|nr:hypothetical protein TNCV_1685801 [Trichonephila clavipes]
MNGGHGQRNRTELHLLSSSASACIITMVGFEFAYAADTPSAATSENIWSYVEAEWTAVHKDRSKASFIQCRDVWQWL